MALLAGCADLAQLLPSGDRDEPALGLIQATAEPGYPPSMATAARIANRGALVVGVRYDLEPFSYIAADNRLAGLEIDLARELARRWLGSPEAVRFRQVRSDTAYQYVADGTVDLVLAGLTHTQDADVRADFSPPYFTNGMALLTLPDTGITGLGDLEGRRVGTLEWTDGREVLAASVEVSPTYASYGHFFDVVEALRLREIDAYADQRHRLERARRSLAGATMVGQWTDEPVAMVFRQDDPFFYDLVLLTFLDMAADGTRDALYERWLPGTSPPSLTRIPGDAPAPPLEASPPQLSNLDIVARVRDRNSLVVGYFRDRWPYSADRTDGLPTGFEVRLIQQMVEIWLGSASAVSFVPMLDEADASNRLASGEVDLLIGNWLHTREAELRFDFSIPILDDGVSVMSLAGNPINEFAQLSGQPVGVVSGSSAQAAVPALSQGVGLSAVGYANFEGALAGLQAGEVVALLTARRPALAVHFVQPGYAVSDRRFTTRPVAFMLPEGDSDFRDLVNLTLIALEAQGVYQELYSVWFDDPVPQLVSWPGRAALSLSVGP
jgi:aspartate/glutamate/glutamine transport system substrate-binding protein